MPCYNVGHVFPVFPVLYRKDGTSEPFNDAMSDMGLSDTSTLCPGVAGQHGEAL